MNDNFENNFENEQEMPETPEMPMEAAEEEFAESAEEITEAAEEFAEPAAEEAAQEEDWEEEPEEKLYDDMDNAFREEGEEPTDEEYPEIVPEAPKKNAAGAVVAVIVVVILALLAFLGIKLFGGAKSDLGAGNISNMTFMTACDGYTYYIEPSTYAICRFKGNISNAEIMTKDPDNNPALFLTNIEDSLYYVSMLNGSFMRYVDGENDEIVISGQCYYPTYVNGTLYYLNLADYFVYAIPVTGGVFGEAAPVLETEAYYLNIYENTLYYIGASDSMLYAVPLDGSADPVQVSTSQMSYINIADGYIYFMRYPDEAATVTPALCRISTKNYETEEVILDNSYCIYNNYYDGYIYYMNYTPAEEDETVENPVYPLYCVKADGSEAPYQVSPSQGLYIHVIDGYVYYLSLSDNNVAVWKRLPVGEADEDGTKAEILPGQELLPLTDEPFALEDLLGEENTEATQEEITEIEE